MVTTSDAALMNGGMMVEASAMGPTTVMGQIMGALNTGLSEDMSLNIETLDCSNGFDCNVEEVNKLKDSYSEQVTLVFFACLDIKITPAKSNRVACRGYPNLKLIFFVSCKRIFLPQNRALLLHQPE